MAKEVVIKKDKYVLVDQACSIGIPDSFVVNKTGTGHGEAKLYMGTEEKNTEFWDEEARCCFLKKDLVKYMDDARSEFEEPQQAYQDDIAARWDGLYSSVSSIEEDIPEFTVVRADVRPPRYYIASKSPMWTLFRNVALPAITFLTIFKLQNKQNGRHVYYFQPILDYRYGSYRGLVRETEEAARISRDEEISRMEKQQLLQARHGQGSFRTSLLNESGRCVVTGIAEPALLVAGHIKPWTISSNSERLDKHNGLVMSPTFDRLFYQGFITFERSGNGAVMLISDHVGEDTKAKLGVDNNTRLDIPGISGREPYLKHHQSHTFRG